MRRGGGDFLRQMATGEMMNAGTERRSASLTRAFRAEWPLLRYARASATMRDGGYVMRAFCGRTRLSSTMRAAIFSLFYAFVPSPACWREALPLPTTVIVRLILFDGLSSRYLTLHGLSVVTNRVTRRGG